MMARRFFLGMLITLGWGLLTGGNLRAESSPTLYFPLAVGNRWVYESSQGQDGRGFIEAWEIVRQEDNAFVMQLTPDYQDMAGIQIFYIATATGVSRLAVKEDEETDHIKPPAPKQDEGPKETELRSVLEAPLTKGASWENDDGYYEVTAIDKTVTVPAGTFTNCVEVRHKSKAGRVTVVTLYAPGVGVVMRDETYPHLEGSGSLDTTRKDQAILRLKEWEVASP